MSTRTRWSPPSKFVTMPFIPRKAPEGDLDLVADLGNDLDFLDISTTHLGADALDGRGLEARRSRRRTARGG